jgi:hypothetical protein
VFEDRVFELDFALDLDWMRESALINLETWGKRDLGFGASGLDRTRVSLVPLAARTLMRLFLFFSAASKSPARKDSRSWKRASPSSEEGLTPRPSGTIQWEVTSVLRAFA